MLYYLPEGLSLHEFQEMKAPVTIKLNSGGYIAAESLDYNHIRVLEVHSTNPADYLNSSLQPGQILALNLQVEE